MKCLLDFSVRPTAVPTPSDEVASTGPCSDSATATRLLASLKKAGALRELEHWGTREALVAILSRLRFGFEGFAVRAEAEGQGVDAAISARRGIAGSGLTGELSAQVAETLNASPPLDHGVFHVEQPFDTLEFFAGVEERGISLDLGHAS